MTLTEQDLLTRVTKEELDELGRSALELGQADPIQDAISGAQAEVELYLGSHTIQESMQKELWLALAIPRLYPRRAAVPERHTKSEAWAREVLKQIRDGSFPELPSAKSTANSGRWGSGERFNTR